MRQGKRKQHGHLARTGKRADADKRAKRATSAKKARKKKANARKKPAKKKASKKAASRRR